MGWWLRGSAFGWARAEAAYVVTRHLVSVRTTTGEETFNAGDAYYVAPGHTPVLTQGNEVVEFSPTIELRRTLEVVTKNMDSADA